MTAAAHPYTPREVEIANTIINVVMHMHLADGRALPATQSVATLLANYRHELRSDMMPAEAGKEAA